MVYKISLQGGRFPWADFLCYIRYYLHYGFMISMLLLYNILLVITLLTWLLNVFLCGFKPRDFILCFFSKNMSLLLLKFYEVVVIFMPKTF